MHLDGDRRYTDKSSLYYKKAGLQDCQEYVGNKNGKFIKKI